MAEHDARHDSTITKTHGRCNLEKLDFSIQLLLGFTYKWSALSWSKTSICILYAAQSSLSGMHPSRFEATPADLEYLEFHINSVQQLGWKRLEFGAAFWPL